MGHTILLTRFNPNTKVADTFIQLEDQSLWIISTYNGFSVCNYLEKFEQSKGFTSFTLELFDPRHLPRIKNSIQRATTKAIESEHKVVLTKYLAHLESKAA